MGPFCDAEYRVLAYHFFLFASPLTNALSAEVKDDRAPVFCPISKAKFAATLVVWRSVQVGPGYVVNI